MPETLEGVESPELVELTPTEVGEASVNPSTEENDPAEDLKDFNYLDFVQYFPEIVKEELTKVLSAKSYGWKQQARTVKRIKYHSDMVITVGAELVNIVQFKRTKRSLDDQARFGTRKLLLSLTEEQLQKACAKYNVEYSASLADKAEVIEAIIDGMLTL